MHTTKTAETSWPPLHWSYPYVSLDHLGQLDGQLAEIGDIQKGIPVDPFDTGLVVADGGGHEKDVFTKADDLVEYLRSLASFRAVMDLPVQKIRDILTEHTVDGAIDLPKEYGMFICR